MAQPVLETDTIALVNHEINDFFEQSIAHATHIDPSYRHLWENLYDLIRAGGKRLRPRMTILAYEAFGGTDTAAVIPIATAQELLHFCLLIHDDIIDRDYVRYGIPNIAGRYMSSYSAFIPDPAERTHYAHSAAILGGDLMLSGAYQLITSSSLNNEEKLTAQALLARSIFEVAGGELLDTEASFVPYKSGDALKVARYKTASYSFITPLQTGARLAGAPASQIKILNTFAVSLGIAYQLVDDILGVFGIEEKTGKSTSGDIREGKRTYMVEHASTVMTKSERATFDAIFGNPDASPEDIDIIRTLLVSTGARQEAEEAIARHAGEAREAVLLLSIDARHKDAFEKLIRKVTNRTF